MSVKFKKIKRTQLLRAVVTAVSAGLSAGFLAVGAVLLAWKLGAFSLSAGAAAGICAGICVGVATLIGLPLFFALRPSDEKIARRLDAEHGLNEKIQTMVEYGNREGEMVALQRADAAERLERLPAKKITFKRIWHYIVFPVLACALFISALVVPGASVPAEGTTVFEFTERQLREMNELIADVERSDFENELKLFVKGELEELIVQLSGSPTEEAMQSCVVSAVTEIDGAVAAANTYRKLFPELKIEKQTEAAAAALASGVAVYTASGVSLNEYQYVEIFANGLESSVENKVKEKMTPFSGALNLPQAEGLAEAMETLRAALETAVLASGVAEGDGLLGAFTAFIDELERLLQVVEGGALGDSSLQLQISVAIDNCGNAITVALSAQIYNCMMDDYVRGRLADIFELSMSMFPETEHHISFVGSGNDGSGSGSGEDNNGNGGGAGGGESIYGSDDVIYDPDREDYVKYSEVIGDYYAKMMEQLRDSDLTEEEKQYVYDYFEILLSGIKQPETPEQ